MYKPKYRITKHLLNLIEKTGYLRAWIEKSPIDVSSLAFLVKEARIRSTHSSTSIEGNPLTIRQVKGLSENEKNVHTVYQKEVVNYLRALKYAEKHSKIMITEEVSKKLHVIVTRDILSKDKSGIYKKKQNYVINEKGIRVYTPVSPQKTPQMMKDLFDWLNSNETNDMHPVLISAIFHHRLVSIHPFSDGNGRLARILGTMILYQKGFDTRHIYSIDDYFAGDRKKYYEKIQQARELDDDLTYWIEYVCQGINNVLRDVKDRIDKLAISSKTKILLSKRQEEVIQIILEKVSVSSADLQKSLKLTRTRINQIISPLVKSGLIGKKGNNKATKYYLCNLLL